MSSSTSARPALLLLCVLCLCAAALARAGQGPEAGGAADSPAASAYRQLVERAKKGDPTLDYVQLYSAFSDWDLSKKSSEETPGRDAMVEAFKKKDYAKAAALAEAVLDDEYVNVGLHLSVEDAYRRLGDNAKADSHRDTAQKLLDAMLSTGDGKSPQTAYCVISISDEYRVMRHFGYKVSAQAYYETGGSEYDSLTGKNEKTGKGATLFFDISGDFSRCVGKSKSGRN
jgi:hypothetical protein